MSFHLRVGTFNYRRGGWDEDTGRHNHDALLDTLSQSDQLPHVLALTECTAYSSHNQRGLWEVCAALNTLLGDDFYYPFIADKVGTRDPAGLFVAASTVTPIRWYAPGVPDVNADMFGVLEADVAGQRVFIKSVHWDGSQGPWYFDQQSAATGQLAAKRTLLLGDFNATSSTVGEVIHEDWATRCAKSGTPWKVQQKARPAAADSTYRWEINVESMDELLAAGFWDAGEQAGDFTVTVGPNVDGGSGLRIDRIIAAHRFPGALLKGSYRVYDPAPPQPGKPDLKLDHRYVTCVIEIGDWLVGAHR